MRRTQCGSVFTVDASQTVCGVTGVYVGLFLSNQGFESGLMCQGFGFDTDCSIRYDLGFNRVFTTPGKIRCITSFNVL
eukprot:8858246-Pyramimonas_sp.AAC.1